MAVYIKNIKQNFEQVWLKVKNQDMLNWQKWSRYGEEDGKIIVQILGDKEKEAVAKKLRYWCETPENVKYGLSALRGKKGRGKYFDNESELLKETIGRVLVERGELRKPKQNCLN